MDLTRLTDLFAKIKNLTKELESVKNTLLEMQKIYSDVQQFIDLIKNI